MDNIRDKFSSDDEYEEFKNSYNDYKNKSGMFDAENYIKEIIEYQQLIYNAFIIDKKKFIAVPEKFYPNKNMAIYVFYCKTLPDTDTITKILN